MTQPSEFGHIEGYPPGSQFDSRASVRQAGLHRHDMAGISGAYDQGADAIIVSGGYPDDTDLGDEIIYTGQGGLENRRQVRDQELTRGNKALVVSENLGLPVRVIRGSGGDPEFSPSSGYRYDGLFTVAEHWQEPSHDGPLIWRYRLVQQSDDVWPTAEWEPGEGPGAPPQGRSNPGRRAGTIQRVVRNTAITRWVKDLHDHACQICGIRLGVPGGAYSEGAHIKPLGDPHKGDDVVGNVLCLCPNDHVLLDKGAIYIDEHRVVRDQSHTALGPLRTMPEHTLLDECLAYHRARIAGVH